jgi:hypothetical protein
MADGPAASPVVFSKLVKGSGTGSVFSSGQQKLVVETGAACQWVLRVVAP